MTPDRRRPRRLAWRRPPSRAARAIASARTVCLYCGDVCGGTCTATACPAPESRWPRFDDSADGLRLTWAADRARGLVFGLGMAATTAAWFVARSTGVPYRDLIARLDGVRRLHAWAMGPLVRPARRPPPRHEDHEGEAA